MTTQVVEIPLKKIARGEGGYDLAKVAELKRSMGAIGQKVPVHLYRNGGDEYQINRGRHRIKAANELGWKNIKTILDPGPDPEGDIASNVVRRTLAGMEKAKFIQEQVAKGKTLEQAGAIIGLSAASASTYLSLLKLDESIQAAVKRGKVAPTVAAQWADMPKDKQVEAAKRAGVGSRGKVSLARAKTARAKVVGETAPKVLDDAATLLGHLEQARQHIVHVAAAMPTDAVTAVRIRQKASEIRTALDELTSD